jgi:uncharacterized protein YeaO (DUF488 family)
MAPRVPDIRIKRVYDAPDAGDGTRVLIDRLWPRGRSKEEVASALWLKDIAPSAQLRRWFHHDATRWDEFARRYRLELAANEAAVARLAELVGRGRVTLLYGARDVEHNDAVVLAEYMRGRLKR